MIHDGVYYFVDRTNRNGCMEEDWITTEEAVELTGYNPLHIRRLVRAGKINGRKFGSVWQISRLSLLDYLKSATKSKDKRWGPK